MPSETMYQAMLLRRNSAGSGFRGTDVYYEKLIPTMLNRSDAVQLAGFIAFPRMAVVKYELACDTRRKVPGSDVVTDVIGRIESMSEVSDLGAIDWKGTRIWAKHGEGVTFPNVKEA